MNFDREELSYKTKLRRFNIHRLVKYIYFRGNIRFNGLMWHTDCDEGMRAALKRNVELTLLHQYGEFPWIRARKRLFREERRGRKAVRPRKLDGQRNLFDFVFYSRARKPPGMRVRRDYLKEARVNVIFTMRKLAKEDELLKLIRSIQREMYFR
uniref:Uncharacterized protein n=1 Tax=Ceratitis capitata TaxID=7213 RepID=W8CBI1_CERCA